MIQVFCFWSISEPRFSQSRRRRLNWSFLRFRYYSKQGLMSRILNLSLILSAHPSLAWAERDFSKLKYRWILSHILEFGQFLLNSSCWLRQRKPSCIFKYSLCISPDKFVGVWYRNTLWVLVYLEYQSGGSGTKIKSYKAFCIIHTLVSSSNRRIYFTLFSTWSIQPPISAGTANEDTSLIPNMRMDWSSDLRL